MKNRAWLEAVTFAVLLILAVVAGITRDTRADGAQVRAQSVVAIERSQQADVSASQPTL